jgi:biotin carboxylase
MVGRMARIDGIDVSEVTHVIVGFSSGLLPIAERCFGPGQVLFIEEPDVIEMRQAEISSAGPAIAGIIEAPTQDEENVEYLPRQLTRPPRLKAVLPGVEYGVVAAAALADSWGVPGAGLPAARALRDKGVLRVMADAAQIPQPRWSLVGSPQEAERFRARYGRDCVLKPADRQGSLGVILLGPGDDARTAWTEVMEATEPGGLRSRERAVKSRYLAEERLTGLEVSVQALVDNDQLIFSNITLKDILPGRYPIELAHTVPAPVPDAMAARLVEMTGDLLEAVGFHHGIAHAEWIVRDGVPKLVECAARIPGDGITNLIDLAYGVRLVDTLFRVMAGDDIKDFGRPRVGCSIRFVTTRPGTVSLVSGLEQARAADHILEVRMLVAPGSIVRPLRSSLDRIGSVFSVAPTASEAREAAALAAAGIQVTTTLSPARPMARP